MKRAGKIVLIVLAVLAALMIVSFIAGTKNMKDVRDFQLPDIDMATLADGQYEGRCDIGRWTFQVSVVVTDHQITQVLIPEGQMPILPDAFIAELNDKIVGRKEPVFDAVTGATISSKAYMIAITDALTPSKK